MNVQEFPFNPVKVDISNVLKEVQKLIKQHIELYHKDESQNRIKQLEEKCNNFDKIVLERNTFEIKIEQLEEYIEELENEIKGYIGQHDSSDQ